MSPQTKERRPIALAEAPSRAPLPAGRLVLGCVLLLIGVFWLLDAASVFTAGWPVVLSGALTIVGLGVLAGIRRGAHSGLVTIGVVLSALVLVTGLAPVSVPIAGVGERTERPGALMSARTDYELSVGQMTIDLRQTAAIRDQATVRARVGIGELVVYLPADAGVEVRADAAVGEVIVLGRSRSGFAPSLTRRSDGEPLLILELSVAMGKVEVRR